MDFFKGIWNFLTRVVAEFKIRVYNTYVQLVQLFHSFLQIFIRVVEDLAGHRKRIDYIVAGLAYFLIRSGVIWESIAAFIGFVLYMTARLMNYDSFMSGMSNSNSKPDEPPKNATV